ncbi:hypothetical protein [Jiangella muralis]|uniref:hypothetical protein n=1 Tax=Jiangella muralis TaxID=702383 RepID=UPI0012F98D3B|nr:hypothetical protein [Jiangella muralis]
MAIDRREHELWEADDMDSDSGGDPERDDSHLPTEDVVDELREARLEGRDE